MLVVCVRQSQPPENVGFITITTSASLQYEGGQQLQSQLQKPPFPVIGNGPPQGYLVVVVVVAVFGSGVVVVVVVVGLSVVGLGVVLTSDFLIDFLIGFLIDFLIDFLMVLVGFGVVALAIDLSIGFSAGLSVVFLLIYIYNKY